MFHRASLGHASASGHRVVIGGPTPNSNNGVVGVYEEQGGTWTLVGTMLENNDELGHAEARGLDSRAREPRSIWHLDVPIQRNSTNLKIH